MTRYANPSDQDVKNDCEAMLEVAKRLGELAQDLKRMSIKIPELRDKDLGAPMPNSEDMILSYAKAKGDHELNLRSAHDWASSASTALRKAVKNIAESEIENKKLIDKIDFD